MDHITDNCINAIFALNDIDFIKAENEFDVYDKMINSYDKATKILESYEGEDIDSFNIFQEGYYMEASSKKDNKNQPLFGRTDEKTKKKESVIKSIVHLIPRLAGRLVDSIKKVFSPKSSKNVHDNVTGLSDMTDSERAVYATATKMSKSTDAKQTKKLAKELAKQIDKARKSSKRKKKVIKASIALAIGSLTYINRGKIKQVVGQGVSKGKDMVSDAVERKVGRFVDDVEGKVGDVADSVKKQIGEAKDAVDARVEALEKNVKELGDKLSVIFKQIGVICKRIFDSIARFFKTIIKLLPWSKNESIEIRESDLDFDAENNRIKLPITLSRCKGWIKICNEFLDKASMLVDNSSITTSKGNVYENPDEKRRILNGMFKGSPSGEGFEKKIKTSYDEMSKSSSFPADEYAKVYDGLKAALESSIKSCKDVARKVEKRITDMKSNNTNSSEKDSITSKIKGKVGDLKDPYYKLEEDVLRQVTVILESENALMTSIDVINDWIALNRLASELTKDVVTP